MQDREPKGLTQLLAITEDLLFSFPLPADIVKKYEYLRAGIFARLELPHDFTKAWRMQRDAHARAAAEKGPGVYKGVVEDAVRSVDGMYAVCMRYRTTLDDFLVNLTSQNIGIRTRLDGGKETMPVKNRRFEAGEIPAVDTADVQALLRQCQLYRDLETKELDTHARLKHDLTSRLSESSLLSDQMLAVISEQTACIKALEIELKTEETAKKNAEERLILAEKEFNEEKRNTEMEIREQLFNDYSDKIERLKAEMEAEAKFLTRKMSPEVDEKIANLRKENEKLRSENEQIREEKRSLEARESDLQGSSQQLTESLRELSERLKQGEVRYDVIRDVLRAVFNKAHKIYSQYAHTNSEWNAEVNRRRDIIVKQLGSDMAQYADLLLEVDFLIFFTMKLESDNHWLAEKLAELNQENEKMRKNVQPNELHRQIWADVQQSASALKEFEQARSKLLQQFQEKGAVRTAE